MLRFLIFVIVNDFLSCMPNKAKNSTFYQICLFFTLFAFGMLFKKKNQQKLTKMRKRNI